MTADTTRRGILAAVTAAAACATAPAIASDSAASTWDAAFARWQSAERRALAEHDEVRRDAEWEREGEAWMTLIAMPAPHGRALLWKLAYVLDLSGAGWTGGWSSDVVRPIMGDARRLLGGGA